MLNPMPGLASLLSGAVPLPPPDPMGYPVPPLLLQGLAYLTLTLHLLAMHLTVGSLIVALVLRLRKKPDQERTARFLGSALPLGFSYLVTFGIPPLLFVQVLYGQFFYSSSVLLGGFWIHVIPLLILAYAMAYTHKLTRDRHPGAQGFVLLTSLLAALAIGFIYVNNFTLMQTPDIWLDHYRSHPGGGGLNLSEPTLWPRYLFMLVPAVAVAGQLLLWRGVTLIRRGEEAEGDASMTLGRNLFIGGMTIAGPFMAWFLFSLPAEAGEALSGGVLGVVMGAGGFIVSVATGVSALAVKRRSRGVLILSSLLLFVGYFALIAGRDQIRLIYLKPHFTLDSVPVKEQWGMMGFFALTLVAGLAFLIYLLVKTAPALGPGKASNVPPSPTDPVL